MTFATDLRPAVRLLGRSPIFVLTAVVSLAAGVAASSTIFSVADDLSHPAFEYLRHHHTTTFAGMAAVDFSGWPMSLTVAGSSERVFGTLVPANFFSVLGTRAVLGRFLREDEDVIPGARPVVVLTHRFWTRRLGADPHVLERPLRLNNREFAVVGVAEPSFEGVTLAGTDVWLPMAMVAQARGLPNANLLSAVRGVWHIGVGRLAPGRGRTETQTELDTLMTQYNAATPRPTSGTRRRCCRPAAVA